MKQNNEMADSNEILQLVSFNIGEEEFGIDILKVQEINRMLEITKVPNSPSFIEGIINLRGKVIPVIDLRKKLGLLNRDYDNQTRIVVVEIQSKTIGFIVDEVSEVLRISKDITEPPPDIVGGINSNFVTAVGKLEDRLIILLDLEKTLLESEFKELADI